MRIVFLDWLLCAAIFFLAWRLDEIIWLFVQVMSDYGYSIEHILLVDIIPDATVRKAMNDINAGIMPFE